MTARLAVVLENPSAAEGLSSVGETNLAPGRAGRSRDRASDPKLTLVEYGDFGCQFCNAAKLWAQFVDASDQLHDGGPRKRWRGDRGDHLQDALVLGGVRTPVP